MRPRGVKPSTHGTGEHLVLPPPRERTLFTWLRASLAVLLAGPLMIVGVLGWFATTELGRVQKGHQSLRAGLEAARTAVSEVAKSSHLDRTLGLAGELDRLLRTLPEGALLPPTVEEALSRARPGRAGGVLLIGAGDRIAWDVDEDERGRPVGETHPTLARMLAEARWRQHPQLLQPQPGGFVRDNGLAETALAEGEFWVITPIVGGRWVVASHAELDGRDAAAVGKAEEAFEAVLTDITAADNRIEVQLRWAGLVVLAGGALVMIVLFSQFRRRILRPIRHLTAVAERIRLGDLARRTDITTGDELETLGQSMNAMLDRLATLIAGEDEKRRLHEDINRLLAVVSRASDGDLTARGTAGPDLGTDELALVVTALNHMLESIGGLVLAVRGDAARVSRAADVIRGSTERVAEGAERQAVAIDQVSRKIAQLGQRSLEVGRIVELVEEIARETNLLALNASIEATRLPGGPTGSRGFAVVAEEVRKLAERAQTATREIGAFLETLLEATDEAGRAMVDIRAVTRRNADDAAAERQLAGEVVAAARTLEQAIARFKVAGSDEEGRQAALVALEKRRAELTEALRALEGELAEAGAARG